MLAAGSLHYTEHIISYEAHNTASQRLDAGLERVQGQLIRGQAIKGRGVASNRAGRFEAQVTEAVVDEWDAWEQPDEPARPQTRLLTEGAASIVTRNQSPDIPFEQSINPYKGCEHGCVYCFARPTHEYLGLSAGLDFETQIFIKPNAAELLRKELGKRHYRVRPLALGANTDPYQPAERRLRITRAVLEVLAEHRHPVAIVTKSDLVRRDIDVLAPMAARNLAQVFVSITTLDGELARLMEPRASAPQRRLRAIEALSAAHIPCGVLASPMIPGLNDHELERILEAASSRGAQRAGTILIRLPGAVRELFDEWLRAHYPDRRERVLKLIRSCRQGALNDASFGSRMRGTGPYAALLEQRFAKAARRYGLNQERYDLDTTQFFSPHGKRRQLSLFGG